MDNVHLQLEEEDQIKAAHLTIDLTFSDCLMYKEMTTLQKLELLQITLNNGLIQGDTQLSLDQISLFFLNIYNNNLIIKYLEFP